MAIGFHLMLRLRDDRVIAPSVPERRALVRSIWRMTRHAALLVFAAADTHVHLEVARCERREAGELARRIELSLGRVLALTVGFEPARIKPIRDQGHLGGVFRYALRQDRHHGVVSDPLREATCLPDLLGLRVGGEHILAAVRELLPRLQPDELMSHYALAPHAEIALADLADAAAASVSLPDLRSPSASVARTAAVHAVDASVQDIADALAIDARSVRRMRERAPSRAHVLAIRRQLGLRARLRDQKIHTGRGSLAAAPVGMSMT